eukprot:CAMPEP_0181374884 /NCGR_PEP_ID=MMETSP1106-20121128/16302_1 /TAXON_ID=81844 /ORGANISM="Mantoniella antarctica, Strain SL-175" /LENGTH=128 /DNA_ID=CAMNT_0023492983 /DNA_START=428 /DNA_END=811 /DNA_ORIENTATION=-
MSGAGSSKFRVGSALEPTLARGVAGAVTNAGADACFRGASGVCSDVCGGVCVCGARPSLSLGESASTGPLAWMPFPTSWSSSLTSSIIWVPAAYGRGSVSAPTSAQLALLPAGVTSFSVLPASIAAPV